MEFFKVLEKYDNTRYYKKTKNGLKYAGFLVGNELLTIKEREKINLPDFMFERVNVPKNKTYWFFGARLEG